MKRSRQAALGSFHEKLYLLKKLSATSHWLLYVTVSSPQILSHNALTVLARSDAVILPMVTLLPVSSLEGFNAILSVPIV